LFNLTLAAERLNIIRDSIKRLSILAKMPAEEFYSSEDAAGFSAILSAYSRLP